MKTTFLNLGMQPLSNAFTTEKFSSKRYPLQVSFDDENCLVSLVETPSKEKMFNDEYPYYPSQSKTMCEHFKNIADQIKDWYTLKKDKILEIGSSDGVFLKNFKPHQICGVEPCTNFAERTRSLGYHTYDKFWDLKTSNIIKNDINKFKIIYSANCMCHIQDIQEAFEAVYNILDDNGVFIFEDPSLLEVINNDSYDQFYDEHAHIFSIITLKKLLDNVGMRIFYVEKLNTHGGSNRIYTEKKMFHKKIDYTLLNLINEELTYRLDKLETYQLFSERVYQSKEQLRELIKDRLYGKNIIGYGATSKSTTIYNYCEFTSKDVQCITDTTPAKQGKLTPGTHIPIVKPTDDILNNSDYAFLGAWNYRDEILNKERHRKLRFITHVPKVKIL